MANLGKNFLWRSIGWHLWKEEREKRGNDMAKITRVLEEGNNAEEGTNKEGNEGHWWAATERSAQESISLGESMNHNHTREKRQ